MLEFIGGIAILIIVFVAGRRYERRKRKIRKFISNATKEE